MRGVKFKEKKVEAIYHFQNGVDGIHGDGDSEGGGGADACSDYKETMVGMLVVI